MKRLIALAAALAIVGLSSAAFAASVSNCCKTSQDSTFHDYSMDHTAR